MQILMVTAGMGIGGAETYILTLCKELAERGETLTVVSSGGIYVKALRRAGIRHRKLPLNRHDPVSFGRALRGLFAEITRIRRETGEDPVLHAHGRYPAFVCGLAARQTGLRMLTGAHGIYKKTPLLRRLTNWGERTLAVSCDIKQELIGQYGYPADGITRTVNGVDCRRFSPESGGALPEGCRPECTERILYVSRLDRDCMRAGEVLLEILPALLHRFPGLELLIVGDGDGRSLLEQRAREIHAAAGRSAVIFTGARGDVERILPHGTVFVGVSRAALEAMAAGLPVILAGAQGYLGIFSPETPEEAEMTNFCGRGGAVCRPDALYADLQRLLTLSPEERRKRGEAGRSYVCRAASAERMADDAQRVYRQCLPLRRRGRPEAVLLGYYGCGNVGDDLLLRQTVCRLRQENPGCHIAVLTRHPKNILPALGLQTVPFYSPLRVGSVLCRCARGGGRLICGGGTLLQNATSGRSLAFYCLILSLAERMGLRVQLWDCGIGPLRGRSARRRVGALMAGAESITLRDAESAAVLKHLGVPAERVRVTEDAVLRLPPPDPLWTRYVFRRESLLCPDSPQVSPYFAFAVRPWREAPADYGAMLARVASEFAKSSGLTPVILPMQSEVDGDFCRSVAASCGGRFLDGLSPDETDGVLSRMRFVVGGRLHALVLAVRRGIPVIGLSYDPKIAAFLRSAALPGRVCPCFDIRSVQEAELLAACRQMIGREENRGEV